MVLSNIQSTANSIDEHLLFLYNSHNNIWLQCLFGCKLVEFLIPFSFDDTPLTVYGNVQVDCQME